MNIVTNVDILRMAQQLERQGKEFDAYFYYLQAADLYEAVQMYDMADRCRRTAKEMSDAEDDKNR